MQSFYLRVFDFIDNAKPSHLGIYFSLFSHLSILLFAIGLPDFFKPNKIPMPQIIPIEILNISDVTSLAPKKETLETNKNESKKIKQNEEKKTIDKPKLIQKPQPDFNIASVLKDLRNEEVSNKIEDKINEEKLENNEEETKINENLEVSISEMDLVIQQLRSCFNPRAGTQIGGDEMVKISAKIDRAANVRKDTVQIIDTNISKSNPYYKAITESAVATLYNPLCSQLKLPLNKYESWKDLKITIDYSWIKN